MTTHPADVPVEEMPDHLVTPFSRLIFAMLATNIGALVALLTPLQLLLTLQMSRIAGDSAALAFGMVTGIGAAFALIANPIAGRISDRTAARFGRRRTWILTGALGGSLSLVALAFTTEVWQVVIIWCLVQTLFNFQTAASAALFADQVPKLRRGTVSGVVGMAAALGPLVGIAAVSFMTDPIAQWVTIAIIAAGLGVVAVLLVRDPQHRPAPGQAKLNIKELLLSLWLNPRKHPAFAWAWLVRFLVTCGFASATYNAFFLMDRFEIPPERVGGSVLLMSLITVGLLAIASVIAGPISDRLRRQKPFVMVAGFMISGGLILQGFAPSLEVVYLAAAIIGLGTGVFFSIDAAMCVRMLPSAENAGKDLGIINMANSLPQSFVPFVAPALLALGGFGALYITLAIFGVVGALLVLRLPELGHEGDPRWALITRGVAQPTTLSA